MNMNVYVNEQFPYLDFMDIRPGDRVVLKPNLVKEGKETEMCCYISGVDSVCSELCM